MNATVNVMAELMKSPKALCGVLAGTTWGDFQAAMAQLGVRADDELSSIEYGVAALGSGLLVRDDDSGGAIEIRERVR